MKPEEEHTRKLADLLTVAGFDSKVERYGSHLYIGNRSQGNRSMDVSCFWYGCRLGATLVMGMNPGNTRSRLKPKRTTEKREEFYVRLFDGFGMVDNDRTTDASEVVACAMSWMAGDSLECLATNTATAFIGRERRKLEAIAAQLHPYLPREIFLDGLWVYGKRRSCLFLDNSCAYYVGQAQVALTTETQSPALDAQAWLMDDLPIESLPDRGAELERHASMIEVDPAKWHWLHTLDRLSDPEDVLGPLAPLVRVLAENPVASRFFTYTSLNRLCFSASSHYPWVGGFPIVAPKQKGYDVDGETCNRFEAVAKIEASLADSPVEPFFGASPDRDILVFRDAFKKLGSDLRPRLVRRGQWSEVVVELGPRQCTLELSSISCEDFSATCENVEAVTQIAERFLTRQDTIDALKQHPGIVRWAD